MRVRVAGDVKRLRVCKHFRIAVGGGNEPPEAVVLTQDFAPQLDILRRNTLDRFDRWIIAQALLCGPLGPAGRVLLEEGPLRGMVDEGQGAITQEVDGGLMAR